MIISVFKNVISIVLAGRIHFDDINLDKNYKRETSYRQSKLANVLFCRELASRLQGSVQCTIFSTNTALLKMHVFINQIHYKDKDEGKSCHIVPF